MANKKQLLIATALKTLKDNGYSFSNDKEGVDLQKSKHGLSADILIKGNDITLEEALQHPIFSNALRSSDIDIDNFEVDRFTVNQWDMGEHTNYQFKVQFKNKSASPVSVALHNIVEHLPTWKQAPKTRKEFPEGDKMVEISLYDTHFGMLSWEPETGENYDTDIASSVYLDAIKQVIKRTRGMKIDYFLLVIGNDMFHINDPSGTTPTAGNQLDFDTRLANIIECCQRTLVSSINALSKKSPVRVTWIPGNHDPETSYFMLRIIDAWYKDHKNVTVDVSPKPRKYIEYGINLIGFAHGCMFGKSQERQIGGIMAAEAADLWKPDQYREFHKGHYHKKNELIINTGGTFNSIVVRDIPSLCGTDYWHFQKGFVNTSKTAQFFVWDKNYGLKSTEDIHVDMGFYRGEK